MVAPLSHGAGVHQLVQTARGVKTILMPTEKFDIAEAFRLADRVAVLHDGRVIACAPATELQRSNDPRVVTLIQTR